MATQEANSSPAHSAQVVGNAFVEQYYQVLHKSPGHVFKFYQESSFLSRPDSDGNMTTVTTTQAINGKITSLNYEDYTAEIETADAQDSYERGVIVLVTGSLTGKDNVRRKFTQSFFLAPQDNGFFVLNDVFRFVEEKKVKENDCVPDNVESEIVPGPPPIPSAEQITIPEDPSLDPAYEEEQEEEEEEEDLSNAAEVYDPSDNEDGSVIEEEVAEPPSNLDTREIPTEIELAPAVQEDPPKQSYASILKVARSITTSSSMYIPTKMAPAKPKQPIVSAQAATQTEAPGPVDNAPEKNNVHEAEGHSIYIRNLPQNASVDQLEEVLKKFGPIKQGGIQVRSNKGFCFGFVEFEELSSVDTALKASPITIGDCQAVVEEKRTTTRVGGSGRGRYVSGRGGFRSDSFRGRGGRGYGRSEFRGQGDFSGRLRSSSGGGGGDAYQRASQNGSGRGRGGRQSESPRA